MWEVLRQATRRVRRWRDRLASRDALDRLPLRPPLPLPAGVSEAELVRVLSSLRLSDERPVAAELETYCRADFRRFVYTLELVPTDAGQILELGANPYFTTLLLKLFRRGELRLANYFGWAQTRGAQRVVYVDLDGREVTDTLEFDQFNLEAEPFPYPDAQFDVVLLCEVLEHLVSDPVFALNQVHRVLRHDGVLILTTPNVARLENVARLIGGENLYDPYSGYGPYGRHNREYTGQELVLLLEHCGFHVETLFSADVRPNGAAASCPMRRVIPLVAARSRDLGQYLFARCRKARESRTQKPRWLYRSYPEGMLE